MKTKGVILLVAFISAVVGIIGCQTKQTQNEPIPAEPDYQDSTQWYVNNRQGVADIFYIISIK